MPLKLPTNQLTLAIKWPFFAFISFKSESLLSTTLPRCLLYFSHSVHYIYDFCSLPDPDVGPSIFVCDVEHTSFHFGVCGRKLVLCLFVQCPGLCTICHSWQHTGVVHLSLQADGKVAFEDILVFGVCRPACHDSSLYLFALVLFLEAVVLSQNTRSLGHFLSESESESERYLFDPYKKCIQSNNETILDQGTPIKTSLVANIRAAYDIINNFFSISQAKNT